MNLAFHSGSLIGHPVEFVRVALTDGASHAVDSSELAFKLAAIYAFRKVECFTFLLWFPTRKNCFYPKKFWQYFFDSVILQLDLSYWNQWWRWSWNFRQNFRALLLVMLTSGFLILELYFSYFMVAWTGVNKWFTWVYVLFVWMTGGKVWSLEMTRMAMILWCLLMYVQSNLFSKWSDNIVIIFCFDSIGSLSYLQ